MVKKESKIKEWYQKLDLPVWWIKSVIKEYLTFRPFLKDDKVSVFEFSLINDDSYKIIKKKKGIIPDYILIQNITPEDLGYRLPLLMTGESNLPIENKIK